MLTSMRLYLVRHAKAEAGPVDSERPLSERGKQDAARMASFLGRSGNRAARVIHSGRVRARDTAVALAAVVGGGVVEEADVGLDPDDDPDIIAEAVDGWNEDTMLVGHQPHMSMLVARLVSGESRRPVIAMPTCAVVCLKRNNSGYGWTIAWMATPKLLGQ